MHCTRYIFHLDDVENKGGGEIIEKLIARGANKELRDRNGMLGIHLAAINGNCEIIEKLLNCEYQAKQRKSKIYKSQ